MLIGISGHSRSESMELVAPHPPHDLRGLFARGAVWTTGARHQHHQHVCENAGHSEV